MSTNAILRAMILAVILNAALLCSVFSAFADELPVDAATLKHLYETQRESITTKIEFAYPSDFSSFHQLRLAVDATLAEGHVGAAIPMIREFKSGAIAILHENVMEIPSDPSGRPILLPLDGSKAEMPVYHGRSCGSGPKWR